MQNEFNRNINYRSSDNNLVFLPHQKKTNYRGGHQQQQHNATEYDLSINRFRPSLEPIVLHVKNLDYKISPDEWKRILLENFRKHCKEVIYQF